MLLRESMLASLRPTEHQATCDGCVRRSEIVEATKMAAYSRLTDAGWQVRGDVAASPETFCPACASSAS